MDSVEFKVFASGKNLSNELFVIHYSLFTTPTGYLSNFFPT